MNIQSKSSKTILLHQGCKEEKRAEIKNYFNETFDLYESLFTLIREEKYYHLRSEPLRHPLIFYYGHTATFFINKLLLAKMIDDRINPDFESMFAIGVDEMSWDDLNEKNYSWPALVEVQAYRDQARALVNETIDNLALSLPINQEDPAWIILMGIEHERIHLETSSVLIRMLPIAAVKNSTSWESCKNFDAAPKNKLLNIKNQNLTLGKPCNDITYGWDNEYGEKKTLVDGFRVSQYLVSNQEYLDFINAGGYQNSEYWTEEGKAWLAFSEATLPRFWLKKNNEYWQRNLTQEIPLP